MASIVLLTHRSTATDLLARELARNGLAPSLVVLEERSQSMSYGRLSRWARGLLGDSAVNRLARLRFPEGSAKALRWERQALANADAWLSEQAEARGIGGPAVDCPLIETVSVNAAATVQRIRLAKPDLMLVFGTRLLKPALIAVPATGSINMHSSLLPHDRGSMPEFWQCHRGDLSHAGVTFHLITEAVDAGDILHRIPAGCEWPIDPYRLRAVNLLNAIKAFPEVASAWLAGGLQAQPQEPNAAPPHRMRDLTVQRRVEVWKRLRRSSASR